MQIIKKLPYDILQQIYKYDDTYKKYFSDIVLQHLKFKIYKIKYFIHSETNNILILYKNKIFIHCDSLKKPQFVSTCIFNNKFPIFDSFQKIKNYPEFELKKVSLEKQINIIKFIENKYSDTFHPFIGFFL